MLKQVLGITVPPGVFDGNPNSSPLPSCKYQTADKSYVLVTMTDDPAELPASSFEGVAGATRATAPGITRGMVADLGGVGRGRSLIVKDGTAVSVDIDFQYQTPTNVFTTTQLQALAAAVAANL